VKEVVDQVGLTTWSVSGPELLSLADEIRHQPGVQQAVAFGAALHVSGEDAAALEQAIAPYRREPYTWRTIPSGLEDVFIHLMDRSQDNFAVAGQSPPAPAHSESS
jgi:ABC-2 type transport system ATP-binding protein